MSDTHFTPPSASVTPTNTVAFFNKDLTDASNTLPDPVFSGARCYRSTTQSITSTLTAIAFDLENYDTDSYHELSTNNTRLTIPTTGYYRVTASAPTSGNTAFRGLLRLNGTTTIQAVGGGNAAANADNGPFLSTDYYFTAGDYVEFLVAYLSATSNASAGVGGATFSIQKIG